MFSYPILFWFEKICVYFYFRRKTAIQHTESSDSEENEISELPQKMKGSMKWI